MVGLIGEPDDSVVKNLKHRINVLWYDGPLLCLYKDDQGNDYLRHFVDASDDGKIWRYMVLKINAENAKKIEENYHELPINVANLSVEDHAYFADVHDRKEESVIVKIKDIPYNWLFR